MQSIDATLDRFAAFPDAWDSYAACAFTAEHVERARALAHHLAGYAERLHISPYPGGIQIEIERGMRNVTISVLANGTTEVTAMLLTPQIEVVNEDEAITDPFMRAKQWADWVMFPFIAD